jgi:hypothetical protein
MILKFWVGLERTRMWCTYKGGENETFSIRFSGVQGTKPNSGKWRFRTWNRHLPEFGLCLNVTKAWRQSSVLYHVVQYSRKKWSRFLATIQLSKANVRNLFPVFHVSFVTEITFKARFDSSTIVLFLQTCMAPENNKPQRGPTTLVGCDVVECWLKQQKYSVRPGKVMSPKLKNFPRPLFSRVACGCILDSLLTYLHESLWTAWHNSYPHIRHTCSGTRNVFDLPAEGNSSTLYIQQVNLVIIQLPYQ